MYWQWCHTFNQWRVTMEKNITIKKNILCSRRLSRLHFADALRMQWWWSCPRLLRGRVELFRVRDARTKRNLRCIYHGRKAWCPSHGWFEMNPRRQYNPSSWEIGQGPPTCVPCVRGCSKVLPFPINEEWLPWQHNPLEPGLAVNQGGHYVYGSR